MREKLGVRGLRVRSLLVNFFFIVKFVCPVEASPFVADPRILIVLFYFFFLPAASGGTEKVLGGGVLARHLSNIGDIHIPIEEKENDFSSDSSGCI